MLTLIHRPGHVFEVFDEHTAPCFYEEDLRVKEVLPRLGQVLVEFAFVMPRLPADEPGRYPILCLTGEGSVDRPGESDVFVRVTYEPSTSRFHFGMNAGNKSRQIQWVSLGPAPADRYTQRVLRAFVLIAHSGLYPSIDDPVSEEEELFGELALANVSQDPPWGKPPEGTWRLTSSAESSEDEEERSLPAGFGLSDVRVTVFDLAAHGLQTLPYSGALDHLASVKWDVDPFSQDTWALDFDDDESVSRMLLDLANQLNDLSGGANTWARRAEGLAAETKELALRLPKHSTMSPPLDPPEGTMSPPPRSPRGDDV